MAQNLAVPRKEYPNILRLRVDEKVSTSDLAKRYGVVPRTIAIILGKARKQAEGGAVAPPEAPDLTQEGNPDESGSEASGVQDALPTAAVPAHEREPDVLVEADTASDKVGLPLVTETPPIVETPAATFAAIPPETAPEQVLSSGQGDAPPADDLTDAVEAVPRPVPGSRTPVLRDAEPRQASYSKGRGASSHPLARSNAKQPYGLVVRPEDGEEVVVPFRSLDELMSSARGTLRAAALSPEPVWFSIRQIDEAALEE